VRHPEPLSEALATIQALRAELAAVRTERDALREELRQRREIADRFLAALERRQREAHDREDDPSPERGRLQ
jgi:hypothetical protein